MYEYQKVYSNRYFTHDNHNIKEFEVKGSYLRLATVFFLCYNKTTNEIGGKHMVYNKHEWQDGELITKDKLSNIENYLASNDSNIVHKIQSGTLLRTEVTRLVDLSENLIDKSMQEVIIDPRSGYRYGFTTTGGSDRTAEDLLVIEFDQFMRTRSTMKVNHGVINPSWLHGQFTQFNYYNRDNNKIEFLLGGPGTSVILEYFPDKTVNYDDLITFFKVDQQTSWTQAVDFDNNIVFSVRSGFQTDGTYMLYFYVYDLNPENGTTVFKNSYPFYIEVPNGFLNQGISAAPASSYIGRSSRGTLVFVSSGGMVSQSNEKKEFSVRTFLYEDGKMSAYSTIDNIQNSSYFSDSQNRLSDIRGFRNNTYEETYKETEGSSQVKINGKWVFTTTLVYGRGSNTLNSGVIPEGAPYQFQMAFGDPDYINQLTKIGKPLKRKFSLDYDVSNLYKITLRGKYDLSAEAFPYYEDVPFILRGNVMKSALGIYSSISIVLNVEHIGINTIKQTLTINIVNETWQDEYTFKRMVTLTRDYGTAISYTVSKWKFDKNVNIGTFTPFPIITKSTNALLPGYSRFIATGLLADFFSEDNFIPTTSGLFETLDMEIPLEYNNTFTRIIQRFTTYSNTNVEVFERIVQVYQNGYSVNFPSGLGGGYATVKALGTWTKI